MIVRGPFGGEKERVGKTIGNGKGGKDSNPNENPSGGEWNNTYYNHRSYGSYQHCPCHCVLRTPALFPRAARNLLLLNVFAIRKTSLVTSNLLLQRLSKRALPVCQR